MVCLLTSDPRPLLYIPISRLRPIRGHSKGYDVIPALCYLAGTSQGLKKSAFIKDYMVGREDSHHTFRVTLLKPHCRKPDTGRRIPAYRLSNDVFRRQIRYMADKLLYMLHTSDNIDVFRVNKRKQPVYCLPYHGLGTDYIKELLWPLPPAPGPESGALPTCHYYCVHISPLSQTNCRF